jgi:hypothetical protein
LAVFDFALWKIKHGEQAQRDFGGLIESEFKSFVVHGRLLSKTDRKMRQTLHPHGALHE